LKETTLGQAASRSGAAASTSLVKTQETLLSNSESTLTIH
jgi:hypothetical protein